MKLTLVPFLSLLAACKVESHGLPNMTRALQECADAFQNCENSECCDGRNCVNSPFGNICVEEAECSCPVENCNRECPPNSVLIDANTCPRTIDDCDCDRGYERQGSRCVCSRQCPENSKVRRGTDCPKGILRDCRCDRGYEFVDKECLCAFSCPANSQSARECPLNFDQCECDPGHYKIDGRCDVDVAIEWTLHGVRANIEDHNGEEVGGDRLSCTQGPPRAALQLAAVSLAMFDAYNSIDTQYEEFLTRVDGAEGASIDAAVAQAAHDVLVARYPLQADYFDDRLAETLARVTDDDARALGVNVGQQCAAAVLQNRIEDESCEYGGYEYEDPSVIGAHQDDPAYPAEQVPISPDFGEVVQPFIAESIIPFSGRAPPALDSQEYADAHNQVRHLGANGIESDTTRNYKETVIAWYHSYNASPEIGTPTILLVEVALVLSRMRGLTPAENIRLFALVNTAMANGGIASWREKFGFNLWRPVVGIRRAAEDGNDGTLPDAGWVPLGAARSNPFEGECNFSPPFPAFTSGHATFCGAGMKAMINFFGTNDIEFDFESVEFNGVTFDDHGRVRPRIIQTFPSLSVFSSQCAASRVFNGVHWSFDGTVGAGEGYDLADFVFENALRPLTDNGDAQEVTATAAPDINEEIQGILTREIEAVMRSPDGDDVERIVTDYLRSPPQRRTCFGVPQ